MFSNKGEDESGRRGEAREEEEVTNPNIQQAVVQGNETESWTCQATALFNGSPSSTSSFSFTLQHLEEKFLVSFENFHKETRIY